MPVRAAVIGSVLTCAASVVAGFLPSSALAGTSDLAVNGEVLESNGDERTVRFTLANLGPDAVDLNCQSDCGPFSDYSVGIVIAPNSATILSESPPCSKEGPDGEQMAGDSKFCVKTKTLGVGETQAVDVRLRVHASGFAPPQISGGVTTYQPEPKLVEDPNPDNDGTFLLFADALFENEPPANRPPIARSDHWRLSAGSYVYDNALKNDSDPDGDRFTPRVTSISFSAAEWSGMERNGTFNYVSGRGTRVHQRKVITYHLVDSKGARSAPATVTIDVIPPGARGSSPVRNRSGRRASAAAARWYKHPNWIRSCFGSGFDKFCFTAYSQRQVQAMNAATPWVSLPTSGEATRACFRAFSRAGVPGCVGGLLGGGLVRAGDKQIIRTAASGGGYCLIARTDLNRTPLHPLAGRWTKPDFHPINSFVKAGTLATWPKGLTKTWQVPMSCTPNNAWAKWYENLVVR